MSAGLTELEAVLAVAQQRNFRAAAAAMGVSRSALSHAVAQLEARLGVRLFHRATRSVTLTDAGRRFVEAITNPVADIKVAIEGVGALSERLAGRLRLNMFVSAARQLGALF